MKRCGRAILGIVFILLYPALADEPVDWQMITRIKQEGLGNSRVMETLSYLTDLHGPRLTGSLNYKNAAQWCRQQLSEWGLENAHLESWTFGRGWSIERYSAEMLEPYYMNLIACPKAWTPGTNGAVSGQPLFISLEEENFEQYRGKLAGAIVMLGEPIHSEPHFEADAQRYTAEQLTELTSYPEEASSATSSRRERFAKYRAEYAKRKELTRLLAQEGAAATLEASPVAHGTLRVLGGGAFDNDTTASLPALVIAMEQYNQIVRLLKKNIPVKLEINVQNRFHTEDSLGYNVIAEIPGSDRTLKKEVVMLGAHLDSWHAGAGATDNASGCAVMMEAMRILKALDVKPRRTIRIALWGGEEQGLLGSKDYVKRHFADPKTMNLKPDHANFSAYYNIDNGTGKIRGIYLQENDAVRPIFEAWLKPFHDMGATTLTFRKTRSTDHISFDAVGLPGFQFIQDPIEYFSRTWHTNMDVYDHLLESDLKQMSIIVAAFVYHTAMRDEKLPRKPLPQKTDDRRQ